MDTEMMEEIYSFDEAMYMDTNVLDAIDVIATDLFEIEESALIALALVHPPCSDQLLSELNFPTVSELLHIPVVG